MSDFILIDNDQAIFLPFFGSAIVSVQPGNIKASGGATLNGTTVCIEGDEKSVEVPGCSYMAPPFFTPGVGTLYIDALAPDQIAKHTDSNKTHVLLKGSMFKAKFQVSSPAMFFLLPDPMPIYFGGQGFFVTTNTKFTGT